MSRQTIGAGFKPGLVDCVADQTGTGSRPRLMVEGRAAPNYNAAMLVQDVGEFELIDLLESSIRRRNSVQTAGLGERGIDVTLGIGDDAAAWTHSALTVVSTTDTMVDGVHFTTGTTGWRDLGWKAMASNLSDVAAMGCAPTVALVTLGLRGDIDVDGLKAMYSGMMDACEAGGCAIVGGDIVRSDTLFVTIVLQGVAPQNASILTRGAACEGDALAVTGHLGSSAGGLRLLLSPEDSPSISLEAREYLIAAHNRPNPRTQAGQTLRRLGVRCAMDVSDGLVADVGKLCAASGVSAIIDIDAVPVHPCLVEAFPDSWRELALTGGEDYELVFTADQATMRAVANELGDLVTVIGSIQPGDGSVKVEDASGRRVRIEGTGWDHFGG